MNGSFSAATLWALARAAGVLLVAGVCASACSGDSETGAPTASTTTIATSPETTLAAEPDDAVEETTAAGHPHTPWSRGKLESVLAGARVPVDGKRISIDLGTLTCAGEGAGRPSGGVRAWTHFSCIQPTFPRAALVGPDASFLVHATGRTTFVVTHASLSRY